MDEALEVADRFFAAAEAGDIATIEQLYAPDAQVWHNTDRVVQNREENLRTLTWITTNLRDIRYTNVRRSPTDDGFVQQHVFEATNRAGQRVEVPACVVATVRDGRITRIDEYIDSAAVTALMAT